MQILREYIPPHYFPVEQGHSLPHRVQRDLFLKVFHGRRDKFWEANLLRGWPARGINDQIVIPRAGEFTLGEQSEDCLEVRVVGLVVRGNYEWCLVMFVIFLRFGGAELGDVLKSFGGWQCKQQEGGATLMGKWGSHYM